MSVISRKALGTRESSRFDAEAFRQDDIDHEAWLRNDHAARTLSSVIGDRKRSQFDKRGLTDDVSYVSITSIDGQDGAVFADLIKKDDLPSRAKWLISAGDILVSQVRPERGAVGWASSDLQGSIGSSGCYLVPASKMDAMERAALFLYLRTDSARRQIVRRNRNSMYPAVAAQDLDQILIPDFSTADFDLAAKKMDEFEKALAEMRARRAEALDLISDLLRVPGIPPSPFDSAKPVDTTVITRSAVRSASRIDAEFFRSEYGDFAEKLQRADHFPLNKYFELISGRVVNGDDPVPIIKQGMLTNYGPNVTAVEVESAKRGKGVSARKGDIALASTAHEVAYVGRKVDQIRELPSLLDNNQVVAELMLIRPRNDNQPVSTSYVTDFLRHPAGRHQVQRCIRGLRGGHTYPQDVGAYVLLPHPDDAWMARYELVASAGETARARAIESVRVGVRHMSERFNGSTTVPPGP
ncbi:hypothetical protein SAMN02800687_0773 [Curtobacterium sp. UNCCL20]|uniref:hypothetical protein n=1 Tax=Curtobacterium sp. UNCCL20 TaxID=1502773 RepID=UPI0008866BD8|nr:hypothetical protein [Curtobacterium sp. UNCCL20]SDQ19013.1 hypothetical protein SAMN02800687_0773 [Curtobacterium sp. UNCCL20]